MNEPIMMSPNDLIQIILSVCVAITTISAAIVVIIKVIQKIRQPEKTQNYRITQLENKVSEYESVFTKDNRRLRELEEGNHVTQQAILALLSHSINGNNVDELKQAKDDLQTYLIKKGELHNDIQG